GATPRRTGARRRRGGGTSVAPAAGRPPAPRRAGRRHGRGPPGRGRAVRPRRTAGAAHRDADPAGPAPAGTAIPARRPLPGRQGTATGLTTRPPPGRVGR